MNEAIQERSDFGVRLIPSFICGQKCLALIMTSVGCILLGGSHLASIAGSPCPLNDVYWVDSNVKKIFLVIKLLFVTCEEHKLWTGSENR
jgi:hypothetical protein